MTSCAGVSWGNVDELSLQITLVPVQTLWPLGHLHVRALGLLQTFDSTLVSVLPIADAVLETVCADPRPLLPLRRTLSQLLSHY